MRNQRIALATATFLPAALLALTDMDAPTWTRAWRGLS